VVNTESDFNITYNDTGARVTEIIYECSTSQYCCDDGCCSNLSTGAIVGIILACLAALSVLIWCITACVRESKKKKVKEYEDMTVEADMPPELNYGSTGPSTKPLFPQNVPPAGYYPVQPGPTQAGSYPPYPYR